MKKKGWNAVKTGCGPHTSDREKKLANSKRKTEKRLRRKGI